MIDCCGASCKNQVRSARGEACRLTGLYGKGAHIVRVADVQMVEAPAARLVGLAGAAQEAHWLSDGQVEVVQGDVQAHAARLDVRFFARPQLEKAS